MFLVDTKLLFQIMNISQPKKKDPGNEWIEIIKRYNKPDPVKSWWQIINSLGPYIVLWVVMIKTIEISYWLTLILSVIAAGFMIRIFIIFHDCGHGSFFKSKKLNEIIGIITGLIVFTPYHKWHYEHHIHHQTVGNRRRIFQAIRVAKIFLQVIPESHFPVRHCTYSAVHNSAALY
jgi:omega-6 fatty acid desaturase (delta-12 desaturase)